ncbi:MAG TPA: hypothetical protein VK589_30175 [Chryseolinea sp.]|nr:hypothetical protein [Chryseolinea sp.]
MKVTFKIFMLDYKTKREGIGNQITGMYTKVNSIVMDASFDDYASAEKYIEEKLLPHNPPYRNVPNSKDLFKMKKNDNR